MTRLLVADAMDSEVWEPEGEAVLTLLVNTVGLQLDCPVTEDAGRAIEVVLPELGDTYSFWKNAEREKNILRDEFFALADAAIEAKGLAIKLVDYDAVDLEDATARARLHHPGWLIEEARASRVKPNSYEVVMRENATLKPFSYEHDGIKYARSVSKGAVMVDDDWLQDANPELYEAVTFELPWGARIMRPLETLPKELVGLLQPYIYTALPRVSLTAPRPVKREQEQE